MNTKFYQLPTSKRVIPTFVLTSLMTLTACADDVIDPVGVGESKTGSDGDDETVGDGDHETVGDGDNGDGDGDPGDGDGDPGDSGDGDGDAGALCGNGVVEANEECDDGNDDETDGCTGACVPATCGDGNVWVGMETCDDGNLEDTDACLSTCEPAVCGDGFLQEGVEACDDGNVVTETTCPIPGGCWICVDDCSRRLSLTSSAAISFTGGHVSHWADDVIGFRFTVGASDLEVHLLGFWDEGVNGLADAHPVGIYSVDDEMLVTSTTIPAGAGTPLFGDFRWVEISPVTLDALTTYVIVAYRPTAADGVIYDATILSTPPFIDHEIDVAANDAGGLVFANTSWWWNYPKSFFGPSFAATPIP